MKAFNGNKPNVTIDAYYRQPKLTRIKYLVLTWQITWSIYIIILKAVLEEKGFFKSSKISWYGMAWSCELHHNLVVIIRKRYSEGVEKLSIPKDNVS